MSVVAILAIVAAIAAPRSVDRSAFTARAYAAEVAGAARLARAIALASGCSVRLTIDPPGYRARQQPAAPNGHCDRGAASYPTAVRRSDGSMLQGARPHDVALSGNAQWTFHPDGTVAITGNAALGFGSLTVAIDPATGIASGP
ncbi:MAG: hypothetical protein RML32_15630 [Gammaproteobacteria bacterium]|nr:hypothetical protein [Gammaproteobacteria bacterium]